MEVTNKPKHSLEKHGKESVSLYIGNKKSLYLITSVSSVLIIILALKNQYLGYNLLAYSQVSFVFAAGYHALVLHKGSGIIIHINIVTTLLIVSNLNSG